MTRKEDFEIPHRSVVISWALSFIIPLIIVLILRMFFFGSYWIPSPSMIPALQIGDRVITSSLLYTVERGDIVVFQDELDWGTEEKLGPQKNLIKRVIAVGGDTISSDGKFVYLNGEILVETYVEGITFSFPEQTVPEHSIFVMGDNREDSADSRYHIDNGTQFISINSVRGEYLFTFWPLIGR